MRRLNKQALRAIIGLATKQALLLFFCGLLFTIFVDFLRLHFFLSVLLEIAGLAEESVVEGEALVTGLPTVKHQPALLTLEAVRMEVLTLNTNTFSTVFSFSGHYWFFTSTAHRSKFSLEAVGAVDVLVLVLREGYPGQILTAHLAIEALRMENLLG